MRIVATACLVLAVLFMVGCGTSAEDKQKIETLTKDMATLKGRVDKVEPAAAEMQKHVDAIEAFLKDKAKKMGDYVYPPVVTAPTDKPGTTPAKPGDKPATPAKPGDKPAGTKAKAAPEKGAGEKK